MQVHIKFLVSNIYWKFRCYRIKRSSAICSDHHSIRTRECNAFIPSLSSQRKIPSKYSAQMRPFHQTTALTTNKLSRGAIKPKRSPHHNSLGPSIFYYQIQRQLQHLQGEFNGSVRPTSGKTSDGSLTSSKDGSCFIVRLSGWSGMQVTIVTRIPR